MSPFSLPPLNSLAFFSPNVMFMDKPELVEESDGFGVSYRYETRPEAWIWSGVLEEWVCIGSRA